MQDVTSGDASAALRPASVRQRAAGALVLLLALAVAGCGSTGQPPFLADAAGATIALESIDGPPPTVFHKFVRNLNEEATARQIAVAAGGGAAPYRLRGYLAAHATGGATVIAWAWDVYDTAERRAFRLQGEEKAGAGRNAWAAADDEVLHRIARASMEQLAIFFANAREPTAPAADVAATFPEPGLSLLAKFDDFRPEAAGIFRVLRSQPAPAIDAAGASGNGGQADDIPLPRLRPALGSTTPTLAFADPGR